MKAGTENRKKTMWAAALMVAAVIAVGIFLKDELGGSDTPRSAPPPPPTGIAHAINANNAQISEQTNAPAARSTGNNAERTGTMPTGNAVGIEAKKVASSSGNLDPTLDESAMLRTEHLVYSGSGRNIFSLVSAPVQPKTVVETNKYPPRPLPPQPPQPPQPPPTCPPQCPPINLKFFGTFTRGNVRQAYLLQGDDVFLASPGDIVARKYKIVSIAGNSIQVEDLTNNNTQTLPLQSN